MAALRFLRGIIPAKNYRPDIDGLRAVAILFVVIFHTFPSVFPGGFIGVDVFFVISGYLITQIIIRRLSPVSTSLQSTQSSNSNSINSVENTVNLKNFLADFYARRIRRIFPALIFLLLCVAAIGFIFLPAPELRNLGKQITWGAFFGENFYLIKNTGGYWETATEMKPLMHLWTLAVEEQYYIFYPFICWFIIKKKLSLLKCLSALCLASFALNLFFISSSSIAVFYSLPTRFWELCAGGILASIGLKKAERDNRLANFSEISFFSELSTVTGFALIILGLGLSNGGVDYPGWRALFPVFGTCLIILGRDSKINRYFLSSSPLVFIGLISYTWYLWHWPLLAVARALNNGSLPSLQICTYLLVAGFGLSLISFYFIEIPVRTKKISKKLVGALCAILLVPVTAGLIYSKTNGLPSRAPDYQLEKKAVNTLPEKTESCRKSFDYNGSFCWSTSSNPSIAVIGDSHAYHLGSGFKKAGLNFVVLGQHGTAPFFDLVKPDQEPGWKTGSHTQTEKALNIVLTNKEIKTVFISARWNFVLFNHKLRRASNGTQIQDRVKFFEQSLEKLIKQLLAADKKVVLLKDVPEFSFGPRSCLKTAPVSTRLRTVCGLDKNEVFSNAGIADAILEKVSNKFKGQIKLIDPKQFLCDKDYCWEIKDGRVYYKDSDHLSDKGSERVVKGMLEELPDLTK